MKPAGWNLFQGMRQKGLIQADTSDEEETVD